MSALSPLVLYGLQDQSNQARLAAQALEEKRRQALANQQTALGYYQTNARLQGQREALTAAAARDANAQAERRYELAGTLASRDLSERRSLDQRANEYNAGAQERMMGRDQQERETDARLWEQGRQFDAGNRLAADQAGEHAREFDVGTAQKTNEADRQRSFEADRAGFDAGERYGLAKLHTDAETAARHEGYGQQRDMVGLNTQADIARNAAHAETAAWLQQQQLSQAERMHLQQEMNKIGAINADEHLLPEEKADMITELRTGISPLLARQKRTQIQVEQEQVAKLQRDSAHAKAIEANNDRFAAGQMDQLIRIHPTTGDSYRLNEHGKPELIPYGQTKAGFEAKAKAAEDAARFKADQAAYARKSEWTYKYMRDMTNPETGEGPSPAEASAAFDQFEAGLRGTAAPGGADAPLFRRRVDLRPFDAHGARLAAQAEAGSLDRYAGDEEKAAHEQRVQAAFDRRVYEHNKRIDPEEADRRAYNARLLATQLGVYQTAYGGDITKAQPHAQASYRELAAQVQAMREPLPPGWRRGQPAAPAGGPAGASAGGPGIPEGPTPSEQQQRYFGGGAAPEPPALSPAGEPEPPPAAGGLTLDQARARGFRVVAGPGGFTAIDGAGRRLPVTNDRIEPQTPAAVPSSAPPSASASGAPQPEAGMRAAPTPAAVDYLASVQRQATDAGDAAAATAAKRLADLIRQYGTEAKMPEVERTWARKYRDAVQQFTAGRR